MTTIPNPKRQAILDAAKRTFLASGYSGASMEAIAEAAPVSKPTLYSHFHSKQELFAAVIGEQCEALLSTLSRAQTESLGPAAGLKAIAGAFVDLIYSNEALNLYRLIIAEQQHFPELGELVYRSGPEPILQRLSVYLGELRGRAALQILDVNRSSRSLLGMLQGDEHLRCLLGLQPGLSEAEKEHLIEAAVSLFLKGHGYDA
ncbi:MULTISPECIES: TetR/AcrR family transcriptional regulator [Methylocaldum]|jgi:TetR/AcrR family transcriptional repressor of mexJK operon|uniref:TetR/AcrR family transcriptional regulator n=1 Tax=unclassified Methylocaldum TaxID=2622260 RepID=UPI00098BA5E4|nr:MULTISPECIES: TetR/AcrR family transcriptional regulator [unclassified Methylocaldum]MBP1151753.1 TetR/AcrR family transcriptional repressor of mexJK operon [Methylocaldum sp. RMAD-M]MVF24791.1 TetR/AcrR family transcriptional regulator [Methylocaldum sp. BRCS4]